MAGRKFTEYRPNSCGGNIDPDQGASQASEPDRGRSAHQPVECRDRHRHRANGFGGSLQLHLRAHTTSAGQSDLRSWRAVCWLPEERRTRIGIWRKLQQSNGRGGQGAVVYTNSRLYSNAARNNDVSMLLETGLPRCLST